MFVVIFRAQIKALDAEYNATAQTLRELALAEYGCHEFISFTEGNEEVALSWWDSLEQIKAWKNNAAHKAAQEKGRRDWYESVSVQVLESVKQY